MLYLISIKFIFFGLFILIFILYFFIFEDIFINNFNFQSFFSQVWDYFPSFFQIKKQDENIVGMSEPKSDDLGSNKSSDSIFQKIIKRVKGIFSFLNKSEPKSESKSEPKSEPESKSELKDDLTNKNAVQFEGKSESEDNESINLGSNLQILDYSTYRVIDERIKKFNVINLHLQNRNYNDFCVKFLADYQELFKLQNNFFKTQTDVMLTINQHDIYKSKINESVHLMNLQILKSLNDKDFENELKIYLQLRNTFKSKFDVKDLTLNHTEFSFAELIQMRFEAIVDYRFKSLMLLKDVKNSIILNQDKEEILTFDSKKLCELGDLKNNYYSDPVKMEFIKEHQLLINFYENKFIKIRNTYIMLLNPKLQDKFTEISIFSLLNKLPADHYQLKGIKGVYTSCYNEALKKF